LPPFFIPVVELDRLNLECRRPHQVARFAHSGEFVLLWRGQDASGAIEVWRLVKKQDGGLPVNGPSQPTPILPPSELAATKSQLAEYESTICSTSAHGAYTPHASLPIPFGGWRSYAFHAPYFALVNRDHPLLVQIYDILLGELHQVVDLASVLASQPLPNGMHQATFMLPFLLDLQLSPKYLCACLESAVALVRLRASDHDTPLLDDSNDGSAGDVKKNAVVFRDNKDPHDKSGLPKCCKADRPTHDNSYLSNVTIPEIPNLALAIVPGVEALEEYNVAPHVATKERGALVATWGSRHNPCFISGNHLCTT
jgi:hypothetical protein